MTIFIKQYGEKRTGTNLLKLLITTRFSGVMVLMHILGDKHSPPLPLRKIFERATQAHAAPSEFATIATRERPAETTSEEDREQHLFLRAVATEVGNAYATDALRFVVSLRHPYAWLASLRRFERWASPVSAATVVGACERFNRHYAAWLALRGEYGSQVAVVAYEDLLICATGTLSRLARQLDLREIGCEPVALPEDHVIPTFWDDLPTRTASGVRFDSCSDGDGRDWKELSSQIRKTVAETIDWRQLAEFGYVPEPL